MMDSRAHLQHGGSSFPAGSCIVPCRYLCDGGLLELHREYAGKSPEWRWVHFFLVWKLH